MKLLSRRRFLKQATIATAVSVAGRAAQGQSIFGLTPVYRQQDQTFFSNAKGLEVIAHRGGNGHWPGETMYAMRRAVEIGVDVLEMDVYLTSDCKLVLMHDNRPSSTTELGISGFKPVRSFSLDQLQTLNAGYEWARKRKIDEWAQPFENLRADLKSELRVPALDDVFKEFGHMRMNIEMKPTLGHSPAKALSNLIRDRGMTKKVLVASLSDSYLAEFRKLSKDVATSASAFEVARYFFNDTRPNASAIQVTPEIRLHIKDKLRLNLPLLKLKHLEKAHKDDLQMHVWTVDDPEAMRKMKALGVDGIITDYPCRLLALENRLPGNQSNPCATANQ